MSEKDRSFDDIVIALGEGWVGIRLDKLTSPLPHHRVHELISALWIANGQDPVYTEDDGTIAAWLRQLDGYPHTTSDPFADMDREQLWDVCHALARELIERKKRAAVEGA